MYKYKGYNFAIHLIMLLLSLAAIIPLLLIAVVSISNEGLLATYGFRIIPMQIDFSAYKMLFRDIKTIGWYSVWTLIISIIRPTLNVLVTVSYGYVLTRKDFALRKFFTWFFLATMFISGGLIPTYIVYSNIYHLVNNPMIYFVISLFGDVIIYRTFFNSVPASLIEAARIDGANEQKVLVKIIIPMSKSIIGIQFFTLAISNWNDYQTSLIYVNGNKSFWSIQYYMQLVLQDAKFLKTSLQEAGIVNVEIPENSLKYAMCLFSLIPIFVIFPYVQRFFSKGIAVGSVKG